MTAERLTGAEVAVLYGQRMAELTATPAESVAVVRARHADRFYPWPAAHDIGVLLARIDELEADREYGIRHRYFPEPHRTGMTREEAERWLAKWVEMGASPEAVHMIVRTVGPWADGLTVKDTAE